MESRESSKTSEVSISSIIVTLIRRFTSLSMLYVVLTMLSWLPTTAFADPLWYAHLKSQGRNSYTISEYNRFVQDNIAKYVRLIYSETEATGRLILEHYNPSEYYFINVGSGPMPIATYLKNLPEVSGTNLPLSGFADQVYDNRVWILNGTGDNHSISLERYLEILKDHFTRFIPEKLWTGKKKILIIDTTETGTTIVNAYNRISEYVNSINPAIEVKALALLHPEASANKLIGNSGSISDIRLRGDLGDLISDRAFQNFAEFTRFEPGLENSADVTKNSNFVLFETELRKSMKANRTKVRIHPNTCAEVLSRKK